MSCDDYQSSVVSLVRKTKNGKNSVLCICNFTPVPRENYCVGVPNLGNYTAVFNSDDPEYGGTGDFAQEDKKATRKPWNYKKQSITVTIPPLSMIAFEYNHTMPKPEGEKKKKAVKKEDVKKPVAKKIAKAAKKTVTAEAEEAPKAEAKKAPAKKAPAKKAPAKKAEEKKD